MNRASRRRRPSPATRTARAAPPPRTARAAPPPPTPRLRISEPGDLLAVVPYLLGFHPAESVVAVFIRSGRVLLTARVDLPPVALAGALVSELAGLAAQHRVADLLVIAYSDDRATGRAVLDELVAGLGDLPLGAALLVDGDRWFSTLCDQPCCPPGGRPYEVETHRLAAEAVYAGLTVRGDRAELQRLVSGPDPGSVARLTRLASSLQPDLEGLSGTQAARLVQTSVQAAVVAGEPLDEADRLRLAMLLLDVRLRDLAWASISRERAVAHVQLWTDVVAVAPPGLASAPLGLLGLAAWVNGDGALQNCCAERMEREDPDYSLGGLLADISARALPPSVWDELAADLRAELGTTTME